MVLDQRGFLIGLVIFPGRPGQFFASDHHSYRDLPVRLAEFGTVYRWEQSGELEKMLGKIADTYERDVESNIMAMTSMLEPVMILVMGVIVLGIVLAILMPIFELNDLVKL